MGTGAPAVISANTHLFVINVNRSKIAGFYISSMPALHTLLEPSYRWTVRLKILQHIMVSAAQRTCVLLPFSWGLIYAQY